MGAFSPGKEETTLSVQLCPRSFAATCRSRLGDGAVGRANPRPALLGMPTRGGYGPPSGCASCGKRGERHERHHAHLYETGRLRCVDLRGHANVLKRLLRHVCGLNLGVLMRRLTGVGTPRSLQGRSRALLEP